jgi:hypothetical protein
MEKLVRDAGSPLLGAHSHDVPAENNYAVDAIATMHADHVA